MSNLLAFNGLKWPVAISKTHIQIGCQNHTIDQWNSFTDDQIYKMADDALDFWKQHKTLIMTITATKQNEVTSC